MRGWLAVAAVAPLVVASAAHAQMKELLAPPPATASPAHAVDLPNPAQSWTDTPAFADGMVANDDVASNAIVGLGLVKMRGRRRDGADMQAGVAATQTRNPAVTFVLKF